MATLEDTEKPVSSTDEKPVSSDEEKVAAGKIKCCHRTVMQTLF